MHNLSEKIAFRMLTCFLVMTLLVPSGVAFSHVFTHQHHEICNGEPQTHLHNADLDCSFYDFKLSTPFTIPVFGMELATTEDNHHKDSKIHLFLSGFQHLQCYLRGPPRMGAL